MTFEVIPSIDVLGGKVVRLERGAFDAATVYSDDPVGVAKDWERQGAARLHVVDLDGAREGEPVQPEVVQRIVGAVGIPVQVAGGIRSAEMGQRWVAHGADRVVLGTAVLTDLTVLEEAVAGLGPRLVIAPDVLLREVRVQGWTRSTGEDVAAAVERLAAAGVPRLLVTDVATDGMLAGPNFALFEEIGPAAGVPVIASGGVSSVDDVRRLASIEGIEGAIVGKALYAGRLSLPEAIEAAA